MLDLLILLIFFFLFLPIILVMKQKLLFFLHHLYLLRKSILMFLDLGARGTGGQVTTPFDFAIMKKTESPDACWEVLKSFFHLRESGISSIGGISSLKSEYDNKMEDYRNMLLARFSDGSWEAFDPDTPQEEIDMLANLNHRGIPYNFEPLDEDIASRIREYLDTTGYRRIDLLPYDVSGIGYEEIQALKGGVGNIDDCARKIQSRVSLWLEEQK